MQILVSVLVLVVAVLLAALLWTRRPRRISCGCLFFLIIIGCDTFGMLLATLLPAINEARDAARRAQCCKNLKRIGMAMQRYHEAYGHFPPSFLPNENGKPKHSWRILILPFLGESDLYARYRFDEPWDSPHNATLMEQMPSVYRCPSQATTGSQTDYAMLVGPRAISDGPTGRRLSDIKGKISNIIMVAEASSKSINWMEPRDLDTEKMIFHIDAITRTPQGNICERISSYHGHNMVNVLFCDGSVQTLASDSVTNKQLEAMITIEGGEQAPAER